MSLWVFVALFSLVAFSAHALEDPTPPVNNAMVFDGRNYVMLPAGIFWQSIKGTFTMELWLKATNPYTQESQPLVSHAPANNVADGNVDFVLALQKGTGALRFFMGSGTAGVLAVDLIGSPVQVDQWTHVAITLTSSVALDNLPMRIRMYRDGEEINTAMFDTTYFRQVVNGVTLLGYYDNGRRSWFEGAMDELRFWRTERTPTQIFQNYRNPLLFTTDPLSNDVVAYFNFDQDPDGVAYDNSNAPYLDGQVMGSDTRETSGDILDFPVNSELAPTAGEISWGLKFTGKKGDSNYVTLPVELSNRLPRAFTFEAWVFLEDPEDFRTNSYRPIVSRFNPDFNKGLPAGAGSNAFQDFVFQVDPRSGRLAFFMGGGRGRCESKWGGYGIWLGSHEPAAVRAFEWTHVAFTLASDVDGDPFSAQMFINGVAVQQLLSEPGNDWKPECSRNFLPNMPISLGHYDNAIPQYWVGRMDEVRIWEQPRTQPDLFTMMYRPLSRTTKGLLAYYKMNEVRGTLAEDQTGRGFHGAIVKPVWVLSQVPGSLAQAKSGFPLFIDFKARSGYPTLPPNNDTQFAFYIVSRPAHGGVFSNEVPIQLVTEDQVAKEKPFNQYITYVSDISYVGPDSFAYVAESKMTGLRSNPHVIFIDVQPAPQIPPPPPMCNPDKCGVCHGDGSSCVGGCDGFGAQFDECGVCGGDASTCTCVMYGGHDLETLESRLFDYSVNRTLVRLEFAIETLMHALVGLETFDGWYDREFDLGIQIDFIVDFLKGCHPVYDAKVDRFLYAVNSVPELLGAKPRPAFGRT